MIGQAFTLAIEMMTEKDFWDKFNKKHNQDITMARKKPRRRKQVVPSQPNDIPYQSTGLSGPMRCPIRLVVMKFTKIN